MQASVSIFHRALQDKETIPISDEGLARPAGEEIDLSVIGQLGI